VKTEKVQFQNGENQLIVGRVYREVPMSPRGIIFCHGLFSTKDGYKITHLAQDLVRAGYSLLTFDFSFVGESGGDIADLSVAQELDDLKCAFHAFVNYGAQKIHIAGSSMGGVVSLLFASENWGRVKSQTLIATPARMLDLVKDTIGADQIDSLPEDGRTPLAGVPLRNRFYREIKRIDLEAAASVTMIPTLIIHGGQDRIVDAAHARILHERLNSEKKLVFIQDGDHNLTRDSDLRVIREGMVAWLNAHP
jgi:putative redox protein